MQIKSLHRITLGGLILVDWGDLLVNSPTMPLNGVSQTSQLVGSQWAKVFGKGNTTRTLSFGVEKVFTDIYDRLGFEVEMDNVYRLGVKQALIIEIENGSTHQIDDFVLTSVTPAAHDLRPERMIVNFEGQAGQSRMTARGGIGGLGWEDINTNWEDLSIQWQNPITS